MTELRITQKLEMGDYWFLKNGCGPRSQTMPTYMSEFIYGEQLLGKPTAVLPIGEPETTEC